MSHAISKSAGCNAQKSKADAALTCDAAGPGDRLCMVTAAVRNDPRRTYTLAKRQRISQQTTFETRAVTTFSRAAATAFRAPLALNAPVRCKFSHLNKIRWPNRRFNKCDSTTAFHQTVKQACKQNVLTRRSVELTRTCKSPLSVYDVRK